MNNDRKWDKMDEDWNEPNTPAHNHTILYVPSISKVWAEELGTIHTHNGGHTSIEVLTNDNTAPYEATPEWMGTN
jgi:hypothetical protein